MSVLIDPPNITTSLPSSQALVQRTMCVYQTTRQLYSWILRTSQMTPCTLLMPAIGSCGGSYAIRTLMFASRQPCSGADFSGNHHPKQPFTTLGWIRFAHPPTHRRAGQELVLRCADTLRGGRAGHGGWSRLSPVLSLVLWRGLVSMTVGVGWLSLLFRRAADPAPGLWPRPGPGCARRAWRRFC